MSDLVHELRGLAIGMASPSLARDTVSSAANEIERLRAALQKIIELMDTHICEAGGVKDDPLDEALDIAKSILNEQLTASSKEEVVGSKRPPSGAADVNKSAR